MLKNCAFWGQVRVWTEPNRRSEVLRGQSVEYLGENRTGRLPEDRNSSPSSRHICKAEDRTSSCIC